jgi:hypothetical protein
LLSCASPSQKQARYSNQTEIHLQSDTAATSATTETTPHMQLPPHHHTSHLFHHEPRQHQPRNVNELHAAERPAPINDRAERHLHGRVSFKARMHSLGRYSLELLRWVMVSYSWRCFSVGTVIRFMYAVGHL